MDLADQSLLLLSDMPGDLNPPFKYLRDNDLSFSSGLGDLGENFTLCCLYVFRCVCAECSHPIFCS